MFDWLDGRAPQLICAQDLTAWPGGAAPVSAGVAKLGATARSSLLSLSGDGPVAAVPLELGGLLLVTHIRSTSNESLSAHLDLLPVSGWTLASGLFEARIGDFALFDGALPGANLARQGGRWILVSLDRGRYEVETYSRWQPDAATEVHLVRMIRAPGG